MFASPSEETAYLISLRYLGYRSRSVKEVYDYLKKKQIPITTINKIIQKLLEQKFLNDEAFAESWVRTRVALKPLSQRVLQMELRQKGITKNVIDKVLLKQEEVSGNDVAIARSIVAKRKTKYSSLTREEIYKKLGGFLARRGFNYDVIKTIIDDIFPS